ncbi:P44/Msp2 family outer membrane protein [Ehrlichia canis]|uniref:P44/Msp2 family outer membrane protein n=1 Tax=Ehrlichia canis TaxID=944 RepID=UPI000C84B9A9|nr:P44/Msp2 family outer membrane protein [Ehrlichia canis]AUO55073.1 P44/Msp2 family outer membrane protein [Ehrlichia canis]AUO55145.1 P44/Msp2 family outer membrane protein [Ehrlichia canis]
MKYKKTFTVTALVLLTSFTHFIPFYSPARASTIHNFYISGKYMPTASHFGIFSAKEEQSFTKVLVGLDQRSSHNSIKNSKPQESLKVQNYSFKYKNNPFLGFAGAIGYSIGNSRIELEVSHEIFDTKNPGNNYLNDSHKYCALSHESHTCNEGRSGNWYTAKTDKFVLLKNEGLLDVSFMLNACYDITTEKMPFSPYICAGIGTDLISMFETTQNKISYQGKLGLNYTINSRVSVFAGGHFHKVIGNEFKGIPTLLPDGSNIKVQQSATVTLDVCHFGLEIGSRFFF